jgi:hypothetical protein
MIGEHRISTFGLTEEQNEFVKQNTPVRDYEILDTDCPTDLIALSASALIVNASVLELEDLQMILDYYTEVRDCTNETVLWLGEPKPPVSLRKTLKCYESFEAVRDKLRYILLSAHTKSKKAADYSKKLADGIQILSLIRKRPGITTQEISEIMELQPRTVQRYIAALQAAGEWIEYDRTLKGWGLQKGISILFGDHLDGEQ